MKNLLFITVFLLSSISFDTDWFEIFQADYFVDSVKGNDSNSGSWFHPWKTISKVNSTTFSPGDRIGFEGTFSETLTVGQSGTAGNPITFKGYGDGATFTGFTTVTGWTNEGGGIYSKTLTVESNPEIVTVNGVQYAMGRTPNSDRYNPEANDYYHIDSFTNDSTFTDSECNSSSTDWDGAQIVVKGSLYNKWIKGNMRSHSGTTIVFSNPETAESTIANGFGYFIQNDLRTLDQFGEWYYGSGKIYMYFGAETPTDYIVKVSTKDKLIDVNTRDFITVKNINFEGANINAIETNESAAAYNLTIDNCNFHFNHSGIYGHRAYEMTVRNCSFINTVHNAIYNHWYSDGAYIGYNTVDSTGLIPGAGTSNWYTGKAIINTYARHDYSSKNLIIEHNTVLNSGFSGITFSGDSAIIRNNYVNTYGLNKADNGGIQFGDQNTFYNMKVTDNIVLNGMINTDADGLPSGASGGGQFNIYFDYNSSGGHTISGNTIGNDVAGATDASGIMVHGSPNMTVVNNTIYNCVEGIKFQELNGLGGAARNDSVTGNIIVSKTNQYSIWARSTTLDFDQFGVIDSNYYAKPFDKSPLFGTLVDTWAVTDRNFSNWQTYTSQDANSFVGTVLAEKDDSIHFYYNYGSTNQTIALFDTLTDARDSTYHGSITLAPFESKVLWNEYVQPNTIDSMYAYYPLNSTSGLADEIGSQDGTNSGAVQETNDYDFDTNTDYIYFPINTGSLTQKNYSFYVMVNFDQLPSTTGTVARIVSDVNSGPSYKVDLYVSTSNTITVVTRNSTPSSFTCNSATGVISQTGTWYLILVNVPAVGYGASIYVNGAKSGSTGTTVTGTNKDSNWRFYLGPYTGSVYAGDFKLKKFGIRNAWFTTDEASYLYNNGNVRDYPFE